MKVPWKRTLLCLSVLRIACMCTALRKEKERRWCKHNRHELGKDVMCSAPPNGCRDIQHPTACALYSKCLNIHWDMPAFTVHCLLPTATSGGTLLAERARRSGSGSDIRAEAGPLWHCLAIVLLFVCTLCNGLLILYQVITCQLGFYFPFSAEH